MRKDNKTIIWAVVALVIGVVIGLLISNVTTGNAIKLKKDNININTNVIYLKKDITEYEKFAEKEISDFIEKNNVDLFKNFVVRQSTNGKLEKGKIEVYDSEKYSILFTLDGYEIAGENGVKVSYRGGCAMYRQRWPFWDYTVDPPVLLGYYTKTGHVTGDGPNISNVVLTFDMV